jgi:hypothetical protein
MELTGHMGGPQNQSGPCKEETNILSLPEFEPRMSCCLQELNHGYTIGTAGYLDTRSSKECLWNICVGPKLLQFMESTSPNLLVPTLQSIEHSSVT